MDKSRRSRDHILGHAPRDPFASSGAPPRKAAVDFSDVFGGPPLRFSGLGDAANVGGGRVGGVEEDGERSRRWSGSVAEKPVFGGVGVGSPAHRRHLGDDFFSDIFRGSESACPTPTKKDLDLFSPSTPGSRVLSPSRPLPPTSDVFGGVSSLPAHLSYSSRLAKSFDHSSSRFPTGFSLCRDDEGLPDELSFPPSPNACAPASPRQSSLSNMAPHGNRPLETATSSAGDGADGAADGQLKRASAPSKGYGGSGLLHFSIYKWASKRVTLAMPSNFKGRAKSGSRLGAASSQVWHRADPSLDKETVPLGTQSAFQNRSEIKEKSPADDLSSAENGSTGTSNEVAEPLPAVSDTKSVPCDTADTSAEEGKPELKDLRHLIGEISDGEGNGGMTGQVKKEEGLVKDCTTVTKDGDDTGRIKQESRRHTISGCSQGRHGASEILEDNTLPTKAKGGRVVEFIKIFSREVTQKTGAPFESQSRRPTVGAGDHASARTASTDQEENGKSGEASSTPITAGQSLEEEEHNASMKVSGVEKVDGFFPQRGGASVSLPGSALDSLDASVCNMEETHSENIEECLVEDLFQDQNEVTVIDSHQEEIEIEMSDSRIQEWSKGKEGNIRSLLSTLQYVLWPGSGWKPVPLVDIIEGASVRRAYQKALLCLHPDKLQQKGAEAHQKYIAEKVFDMLQEAWDHFSSLSSL